MSQGKKTQTKCEDDILRLLATAEGNLLDNLELIATLDTSKETWEKVWLLALFFWLLCHGDPSSDSTWCLAYTGILQRAVSVTFSFEGTHPVITETGNNTLQVKESLEVAEINTRKIEVASSAYKPCAERAALLYFILIELVSIDPMYQFSLEAYTELFLISIEKSAKYDLSLQYSSSIYSFYFRSYVQTEHIQESHLRKRN